jgi:hypothetical protein
MGQEQRPCDRILKVVPGWRGGVSIMCPSPGALASGPAVISCRRRYHCPSSGTLLTVLGMALVPRAAFGVAMLTRFGCVF